MTEAAGVYKEVRLSAVEVEYLHKGGFLAPHLLATLRSATWKKAGEAVIRVRRETAEEFREALTLQLARVGFDEGYRPTGEGQMLEDLIDRFFFGKS